MNYRDIQAEGAHAYHDEYSKADNPYPFDTIAWHAWRIGWDTARGEDIVSGLVQDSGTEAQR